MLARLERDLKRGLRSGALGDRLRRNLKGLSLDYPVLDVVESTSPAQLVERPDILGGFGESERPIRVPRSGTTRAILARACALDFQFSLSSGLIAHVLNELRYRRYGVAVAPCCGQWRRVARRG